MAVIFCAVWSSAIIDVTNMSSQKQFVQTVHELAALLDCGQGDSHANVIYSYHIYASCFPTMMWGKL